VDLGLNGKKVLITGASQGIGRATARLLAEEGCSLYLVARSAADLAAVREEIAGHHQVGVRTFALDLRESANQQTLARECADADVLINNAGGIPNGTLEEVDEATWRAAWDLKVFGYINLCRHFYPRMRDRGAGVILNIIGNGGEMPRANYIAGAAGNAALMAFTRALGGSSEKDGIRVLAINPGPVATERLVRMMKKTARDRLGDESRYRELEKPFPFGRAATSEECAWAAAFLISERSAYTSGTVFTIDGGMVNRGPLF
jgi:NAD(P)-dependent dehydrogenase (short-subunit alcohol dehydrogenase family)